MNFEIKIPGDMEGFVKFECPFCGSEFKLDADECQNDEKPCIEFYCPYCGLVDEISNFYSKEVIKYAETISMNYMFEQINKTFSDIKSSVNKSKNIKMEFTPIKKAFIGELKAQETQEEIFKCPICGNHEKVLHCSGVSKIFCAYCGVDI